MNADSATWNRWFRDAVVFGFLIFLPTGIFFYLQWPEWSWLYYFNPKEMASWIAPAVWLAYPLSVVSGFLLAAFLVRGDSPRGALGVPVAAGVALLIITIVSAKRFLRLTSFEEHAAFLFRPSADLPRIYSDPVWIYTMIGTGIFIFIPFIYLFVRNLREHGGGLMPPAKP